jgi:hypothetical protein
MFEARTRNRATGKPVSSCSVANRRLPVNAARRVSDNAVSLTGPLSGDPSLVHVLEDSLTIAVERIPIAAAAATVSNDCLSRLQDDPATGLELA